MESKTFAEAVDRKDHIAMMKHPEWWGRRPILPLRKYRESKESEFQYDLGYMIEGSGPIVYLGNMFGYTPKKTPDKYIEFSSMDQIVASGWEVD